MTLTKQPRVHPAFRQAAIFKELSEDDLAQAAAAFKRRDYGRGEHLFLEGAEARTYYLIAEGQVTIQQTSADGIDVTVHVLGPGEIAGALPTLALGTYPAAAEALSEVVAYSIAASDFDRLLIAHPTVAANLLRFAAAVIQSSHRRIREMATERVERRIARTLARLAAQVGSPVGSSVQIDTPLSRQDLAEMTGTTVYTVSRTLKEWDRQGIIRAEREKVTILDPHALTVISEDLPIKPAKP